jgi:hypothetical protein
MFTNIADIPPHIDSFTLFYTTTDGLPHPPTADLAGWLAEMYRTCPSDVGAHLFRQGRLRLEQEIFIPAEDNNATQTPLVF